MLILVIGDLHIPDRTSGLPAKFKKLLVPGKISKTLCLGNLTDVPTFEFLRSLAPELEIVKGDMDLVPGLPLTKVITTSSEFASLNANNGKFSSHSNSTNTIYNSGKSTESISANIDKSNSNNTQTGLRIGITHGHTIVPCGGDPEALNSLARKLDVDVLIWGGTHKFDAYELEGKFFLNPGSATGAMYMGWPEVVEDEQSKEEYSDKDNENNDRINTDLDNNSKDNTDEIDKKDKKFFKKRRANVPFDPIPTFCLLDIQGTVLILYVYQYINGDVKVEKVTYRKDC